MCGGLCSGTAHVQFPRLTKTITGFVVRTLGCLVRDPCHREGRRAPSPVRNSLLESHVETHNDRACHLCPKRTDTLQMDRERNRPSRLALPLGLLGLPTGSNPPLNAIIHRQRKPRVIKIEIPCLKDVYSPNRIGEYDSYCRIYCSIYCSTNWCTMHVGSGTVTVIVLGKTTDSQGTG